MGFIIRRLSMKNILSLFLIPLFLFGCGARRVTVKTIAYSNNNAIRNILKEKNKSFAIDGTPYSDKVKQNNDLLATEELKKKISLMLEKKEYKIEKNIHNADYLLLFNYGCKAKNVSYDVPLYIPGQTYTSNATFTNSRGFYGGEYKQTTSTPGSFCYVPEQYTIFTKFINFYVYDKTGIQHITTNNKILPPHIWYGSSIGSDKYDDLRTYLDFLLISIFKLFGENGERSDYMDEDNESVDLLRKQMSGEIPPESDQ